MRQAKKFVHHRVEPDHLRIPQSLIEPGLGFTGLVSFPQKCLPLADKRQGATSEAAERGMKLGIIPKNTPQRLESYVYFVALAVRLKLCPDASCKLHEILQVVQIPSLLAFKQRGTTVRLQTKRQLVDIASTSYRGVWNGLSFLKLPLFGRKA
jgi:hypothetical protein